MTGKPGPDPDGCEVISEIRRLVAAVNDGCLDERGDPARFSGLEAEIVTCFNGVLDALVTPLRMTIGILEKIAVGEIPEFITADSRGEFQGIKRSVNAFLATMYGMHQETRNVVRSIEEGRLATRGNDWDFSGIWAEQVRGVNEIVEAVTAPLTEPRAVLDRLAAYDLGARVTGRYRGEHAQIKKALNASTDALHRALLEVAATTEQVASVGERITETSQTMAEGAADQAISVERTASSLQEIAARGRENAQNIEAATTLAARASDLSDQGKTAAERMNAAMLEIRTAAESTLVVIQEINEITKKTDGLATDAGRKAAQVGEAGRSFAVVAQEVRDLAARFKQTAAEIERVGSGPGSAGGEGGGATSRRGSEMATIVHEMQKMAIETNMLALNAAVEAAHVAEAGIGFERTAANVRELAVQSKEAGARTESAVGNFGTLAQEGEARSRDIDRQLAEIRAALEQVSSRSRATSESIRSQQQGVEAVDSSLGEITGVMQRNTEAAGASAQAAEDLSSQTATLRSLLGRFRLDEGRPAA